jgi:hypothetical protein
VPYPRKLIAFDNAQVEPFLKAMHRQLQSGGKRSFFGKRAVAPQGRDKYSIEDMLSFQRVQYLLTLYISTCW